MNIFKNKKVAEATQTHTAHGYRPTVKYTWILRHFSFLIFLAFLAIIYIANGHWADNTIRDINITAKQVKDMEYEYKNLKSLEMYRSRESQVTQAAAALGLKATAVPPVKLEIQTVKLETEKPNR